MRPLGRSYRSWQQVVVYPSTSSSWTSRMGDRWNTRYTKSSRAQARSMSYQQCRVRVYRRRGANGKPIFGSLLCQQVCAGSIC
jgi:hypothetical protein